MSFRSKLIKSVLRLAQKLDPTWKNEANALKAAKKANSKQGSDGPSRGMRRKFDITEHTVGNGQWIGYLIKKKQSNENGRYIFYYHGGGYTDNCMIFHWWYVDYLLENGLAETVFLPIYPKTPQSTFRETYPPLLEHYKSTIKMIDPGRIVFMGDSAGGAMSLAVAMNIRNEGLPQPKAIVLLSPWLDASMQNPDIEKYVDLDPVVTKFRLEISGKWWAGDKESLKDYRVSPLYGDFEGLTSRICLVHGTHEILYPDVLLAEKKAKEAGVNIEMHIYEGMIHDFQLMLSGCECQDRRILKEIHLIRIT